MLLKLLLLLKYWGYYFLDVIFFHTNSVSLMMRNEKNLYNLKRGDIDSDSFNCERKEYLKFQERILKNIAKLKLLSFLIFAFSIGLLLFVYVREIFISEDLFTVIIFNAIFFGSLSAIFFYINVAQANVNLKEYRSILEVDKSSQSNLKKTESIEFKKDISFEKYVYSYREPKERIHCSADKMCALLYMLSKNGIITEANIVTEIGVDVKSFIANMISYTKRGEVCGYQASSLKKFIPVEDGKSSYNFYESFLEYIRLMNKLDFQVIRSKREPSEETINNTNKLLGFLSNFEIIKKKRAEINILAMLFFHYVEDPNGKYFQIPENELKAFKLFVSSRIRLK